MKRRGLFWTAGAPTISFPALLVLFLLAAPAQANEIKHVAPSPPIPSFLGYVPDRFVVEMKEQAARLTTFTSVNKTVHVGIPELDIIADQYAVSALTPQFPGAERHPIAKSSNLHRFYKVTISVGTLEEAMDAYRKNPLVEGVEPIGIHALYATPNDFYYSPYQWHLNASGDHDIDAPEAWDIEVGSDATVVAILDSGTRYYHPDLGGVNGSPSNPGASRGNMWINNAELNGTAGVDDDGNGYVDDWIGYDFIQSTTNCWSGEDCNTKDNDPRDFNGHGTHTAGIFGMITNDGYGMAGVAGGWGNGTQQVYGNGVRIMALRMGYSYNYFGQEYGVVLMDAAAEAFYYAANNGARIASCSWGSSNSGGIGAAATYFLNSGGLIFVAAGNSGSQTADYLNGRGDCISVAATNESDNAASFTNYGTWVDISAPGNNIYSTYHDHYNPNTNYWAALSGTSMATPMAAGVGALIWSQNPGWTATQVRNQLYASADNIDAYLSSQYIGKMGAGRINAYNAVNTGPPPAPVAEFSGSPTSGTVPLTVNFTDLSTGSITSWAWTFGDGGTSTVQNPSRQYTSAGTYTVSLTVTGPGGSDGETKVNYITVNPCTPPTAEFVGSPTSGDYPLNVTFTNQSTGATSYSWTFGDGGTSTAANPSHTYTAAGTYTVSLTATNSCGSDVETKTDYITVTAPSGPTVITFDTFEAGWGSYTDGGADCSRYTGSTHAWSPPAAINIQDNSGAASSFYHTAGYNVTAFGTLEVEFYFKAVSMEVNENFFVEYYNGSAWQIVADLIRGVHFNNNVFYNVVVTIPRSVYTFPTNARLRFRCDASDNNDDVYIDNVEWRGLSTFSADDGVRLLAAAAPAEILMKGSAAIPESFELGQNYPNPFNAGTNIEVSLPEAANINVTVYDILGRPVRLLASGQFPEGVHTLTFDGTDDHGFPLATGVYFYRLQVNDHTETRKMMLLK